MENLPPRLLLFLFGSIVSAKVMTIQPFCLLYLVDTKVVTGGGLARTIAPDIAADPVLIK